ncbi:stalk domain-containing protein [Cohnella hongkongensis]|uniref:Stalk domain-containing protein n=1 Tax=Cohnella hongkongensis TaxID=178337 RepID=A0ABV9F527_9BACL
MNIKALKKLRWVVCALILSVIVGCQSVGGLNLNDMLMKQLDVSHQEQSMSLELEIELNEELLELEDEQVRKAVELLRAVKLEVSHSKVDEKGHQWMEGALTLGKGSIPFTLHADRQTFRLDVAGAKRPFVLSLAELQSSLGEEAMPSLELQQELTESVRELAKKVGAYFVQGLPNPPVVTVNQVNETINGVPESLTKVHAELNGEQLGQLIPVYLENLIQDKEGFRAAVVAVFEWLSEHASELQLGLPPSGEIDAEEFADFAVESLIPELEDVLADLKEYQEEEEWKQIFDKGITIQADLYLDGSLQLRKSDFAATIAPAAFAEEGSPIRAVKVRASSEMWNVNGAVEIPDVQVPANALGLQELDGYEAYRVVQLFESDSLIYDLLKNDFEIDDQSFELSSEWGIPFYVEDGQAFVPLRESLRKLGIRPNLSLPAEGSLEVQFYDRATGTSITLRKGSDQAIVNGEAVKLSHPVVNDADFMYVSADDLFGLLGAEYGISELEDGELILAVERDL